MSASRNCIPLLERILDQPYEKNISKNDNLLHLAAENGNIEVVRMLISHSMDPDELGLGDVITMLIVLTPRDSQR